MSFFDSLPEPDLPDLDEEDGPDMPPWAGPPSWVLGAAVPVRGIVVRTDHVVVAVTRATAYPSGVSLELQVAVRRGDWDRKRWNSVHSMVFGHDAAPWGARSKDALRLGVELADGSRTSTAAGDPWWDPDATPPQPPVLSGHSGGGSGGMRTLEEQRSLWLWPLPQGDTLDLVAEWQPLDVPVSRLVLDAAALRAGAAAAEPYWPDAGTRGGPG